MRAVFIVLVAVISISVLAVCVHFEDEKRIYGLGRANCYLSTNPDFVYT